MVLCGRTRGDFKRMNILKVKRRASDQRNRVLKGEYKSTRLGSTVEMDFTRSHASAQAPLGLTILSESASNSNNLPLDNGPGKRPADTNRLSKDNGRNKRARRSVSCSESCDDDDTEDFIVVSSGQDPADRQTDEPDGNECSQPQIVSIPNRSPPRVLDASSPVQLEDQTLERKPPQSSLASFSGPNTAAYVCNETYDSNSRWIRHRCGACFRAVTQARMRRARETGQDYKAGDDKEHDEIAEKSRHVIGEKCRGRNIEPASDMGNSEDLSPSREDGPSPQVYVCNKTYRKDAGWSKHRCASCARTVLKHRVRRQSAQRDVADDDGPQEYSEPDEWNLSGVINVQHVVGEKCRGYTKAFKRSRIQSKNDCDEVGMSPSPGLHSSSASSHRSAGDSGTPTVSIEVAKVLRNDQYAPSPPTPCSPAGHTDQLDRDSTLSPSIKTATSHARTPLPSQKGRTPPGDVANDRRQSSGDHTARGIPVQPEPNTAVAHSSDEILEEKQGSYIEGESQAEYPINGANTAASDVEIFETLEAQKSVGQSPGSSSRNEGTLSEISPMKDSTPSSIDESSTSTTSNFSVGRANNGTLSRQDPVSQRPQGFQTFPSRFQVLTTESIQQTTAMKRRGRKPSGQTPPPTTQVSSPILQPSIISSPVQDSPLPSIMTHHHVLPKTAAAERQYTLPPIVPSNGDKQLETRSLLIPLGSLNSNQEHSYSPPAVTFTIDNRAESTLPAREVQQLMERFSKNTSVLLPAMPSSGVEGREYPVGVIMWQTLPDFYSWYTKESSRTVGSVIFDFVDIDWQAQKSFVVFQGNLNYFRALKQYIWDLYWKGTSVPNGAPLFRVSISPYSESAPIANSQTPRWNPVNPRGNAGKGRWTAEQNYLSVHDAASINSVHSPRAPNSPPLPFYSTSSNGEVPMANDGLSQPTYTGNSGTGSLPPSLSTPTFYQTDPVSFANSREMTNDSNTYTAESPGFPSSGLSRRGGRAISSDNRGTPRLQASQPTNDLHISNARSRSDMLALRAVAYKLVPGDMELLPNESSVNDKYPYKSGSQVCGAVIDKRSGHGMVALTGKGYITRNIPTGPDGTDDRYELIHIHQKQTCMLHGMAVVLYFQPKTTTPATLVNPASPISTIASPSPSRLLGEAPVERNTANVVTIVVRIQTDASGKFSSPFDKSCLRPKITASDFFSWYARESGHEPSLLKFTFKDAMPAPTSTEIARGNEDHFNYMRKDIKAQCEKAKLFMPDLKEFVVLVNVPGWSYASPEDEEDW